MRFTVWGVAVWGVVCGGMGDKDAEIGSGLRHRNNYVFQQFLLFENMYKIGLI